MTKRRIFKKMLPDLMREQLTMQVTPHDTWESLKSFVFERARQLAMDNHSKPLNLAEATVPSQEQDITQELNALVNPSAEEVLSVVNKRMNGKFVKAPWKRNASAKPEKDQNEYKNLPPPKKRRCCAQTVEQKATTNPNARKQSWMCPRDHALYVRKLDTGHPSAQ